MIVVNAVKHGIMANWRLIYLWRDSFQLIGEQRSKIQHVFRQANGVADRMSIIPSRNISHSGIYPDKYNTTSLLTFSEYGLIADRIPLSAVICTRLSWLVFLFFLAERCSFSYTRPVRFLTRHFLIIKS